jgi:hypothetical protein
MRMGPRWTYVNPQGVVFHAFDGADVRILMTAASMTPEERARIRRQLDTPGSLHARLSRFAGDLAGQSIQRAA